MTAEYDEMISKLRLLKLEKINERFKLIKLFRSDLNELIAKTPTGDLRNNLTELNILFESILDLQTEISALP